MPSDRSDSLPAGQKRQRAPTIVIDTAVTEWSTPIDERGHQGDYFESSHLLPKLLLEPPARRLSHGFHHSSSISYGTLGSSKSVKSASRRSSVSAASHVFSPVGSSAGSRRTSITDSRCTSPTPRNLLDAFRNHSYGPFAFTPDKLYSIISDKDLAEVDALGGLTRLAHGLKTDLHGGLGSGESISVSYGAALPQEQSLPPDPCDLSEARKLLFGENRIQDRKAKTVFDLIRIALSDRTIVVLSIVATISLCVGLYEAFLTPHAPGEPRIEWVDSVSIMTAVLIVVTFGALNDYQKEKQFAALQKKKENHSVRAIRRGRSVEISVFDILVGDVLHIEPGDIIPADGVLISAHGVQCDESSLTGESKQIHKSPTFEALAHLSGGPASVKLDPFIVSGSKVLEGIGTYLVTGVGIHSTSGRLRMASEGEENKTTPLQQKLAVVADQIATAAISVSCVLFSALSLQIIFRAVENGSTHFETFQHLLRAFTLAITVVVAAVPEGLPLAVTLALAIAVTRMLKENNLVRVLAACETMGNATTICTDKTGTLTSNQMRVVSGLIGIDSSFCDDACVADTSTSAMSEFCVSITPGIGNLLKQSIAVNSTAFESGEPGACTYVGSKTEAALLHYAKTWLGMRPVQEERANANIVEIYPFNSRTKCMATVVELSDGTFRVLLKGAPEVVVACCSKIIPSAFSAFADEDEGVNQTQFLDITASFASTVSKGASESLRTLAFAYKDIPHWPPKGFSIEEGVPMENIVVGMVFLGALDIKDTLREGVLDSIVKCQHAGIKVRMVTGDNKETARSIAKECGILTDGGIILDGRTFRQLPKVEMFKIIPRLDVLARSSPADKELLVRSLKQLGETVAVTGDGTNDGPALKAADVGFSMGISGTEVAKDASSIVLIDDNFSSIVSAIEWGRCVSDAIKKFLNFQLTVNITAVTLTFISALASENSTAILSPVQLLWVNLIMDTLAALALAAEPPSSGILDRAPDRKSASLISVTSWKMIIGQSIYQIAVIGLLSFQIPQHLFELPSANQHTLIFNTFIWMQLFNLYNNRRLDNGFNILSGLSKSPFFIGVNVVIIVGQVLIVTYGGTALQVSPLSVQGWILSVTLGALCVPFAMLIRTLPDEFVTGCSRFSLFS